MSTKRPNIVTLLCIGMLFLTIFFTLRLVEGLRLWNFLTGLELTVSPIYLVATGLVFTSAGFGLVYGLWFGKRWAPGLFQGFVIALAVYSWLDQWLFTATKMVSLFAVGLTLVVLGWVFFLLRRPRIKSFFQSSSSTGFPHPT